VKKLWKGLCNVLSIYENYPMNQNNHHQIWGNYAICHAKMDTIQII
jgi:hypothetical protein